MNPLEKLKQKLMAKPTLNEQKPVVVAIKGETKMKNETIDVRIFGRVQWSTVSNYFDG